MRCRHCSYYSGFSILAGNGELECTHVLRPSTESTEGLDVWEGEGGFVATDARTTRESDASAWERDLDMRGWG